MTSTRAAKRSSVLFLIMFARLSFGQNASAQYYSDDLRDIEPAGYINHSFPPITPIGNLGRLTTVVDLRGFIPMSLVSKSKMFSYTSRLWFRIPTKKALAMLYLGDLSIQNIADDLGNSDGWFRGVTFLGEANATGEAALWCNLAYDMARDAAPLAKYL